MERLTTGFDYCQLQCDFGKKKECFFQDKSKCYENNMYNKLREYEIAEEQGLLLRLPCKVGDTVYIIQNEPTSVSTDGYNSNGWKEVISERKIEKYEDYFHLTEVIHHKVYSTYQEAELELANRQQSHAEAIMDERNGR